MKTTTFPITIYDGDVPIEIVLKYIPIRKGARDRYGIPLEPDTSFDIEILEMHPNVPQIDESFLLEYYLDYIQEAYEDSLNSYNT